MSEHFPTPWSVDQFSAVIYASNVPKGPARVADMRGWGYLTGKGHGALRLSEKEAIAIQRANAAFIVNAVNSHDALVAALRDIISIAKDANARLLWDQGDALGDIVKRAEEELRK